MLVTENLNSSVLLSICIPTRCRENVLKDTLKSIFTGDSFKENFEVIVYDTSENCLTEEMIHKQFNQKNLHYFKGKNLGYLNLIESMKLAKGSYIKLHNDYSRFNNNAVEQMVQFIELNNSGNNSIFFTNASLNFSGVIKLNNFDSLVSNLDYLCSWSTLFGIWKVDFDKISNSIIDDIFPHTSLIFMIPQKKRYILNNKEYFTNIQVVNKGGYNLFYVFSVHFINVLKLHKSNGLISDKTFFKIKNNLFNKFLIKWYSEAVVLPNKYTFQLTNIRQSIRVNFSNFEYFYLIIAAHLLSFWVLVRKIKDQYIFGKRN